LLNTTKKVLESPKTRSFAKAIIRQAFCREPQEALEDIELAFKTIKQEVKVKIEG